jgi:hypothetical protein
VPLAVHGYFVGADFKRELLSPNVIRQPKYAQGRRRDADIRHDGLGYPFVDQCPGTLGIPGELGYIESSILTFNKAGLRAASDTADNSLDFNVIRLADRWLKHGQRIVHLDLRFNVGRGSE